MAFYAAVFGLTFFTSIYFVPVACDLLMSTLAWCYAGANIKIRAPGGSAKCRARAPRGDPPGGDENTPPYTPPGVFPDNASPGKLAEQYLLSKPGDSGLRSKEPATVTRNSNYVAILSDNPLVGQALELLLESAGYEVRLLEDREVLEAEDSLERVDVVLLGRGLSDGCREDLLSALASTLETATIPILSFSPHPKGVRTEEDRLVPWPRRAEDLVREIEAALEAAAREEPVDGSPTLADEASA